MGIKFKFNKVYFLIAIALLIVEIFIGLYMHDKIIRPYGGDYLVVILMYCSIKSIFDSKYFWTATAILIFSFILEFLQYFKLVELLNIQEHKLASIIIGTSFSWGDLIAYFLGTLTVILIENYLGKKHLSI